MRAYFIVFILAIQTIFADPFLEDFSVPYQDIFPYRSTTERFLEANSYSKIKSTLLTKNIYLKQKPFYDVVMNSEERGFVGYHAAGHAFRIFQDIIRITLEEVVELEFKKDFYFFRYPGDPFVNDHPNAKDFLRNYPWVNDNVPEMRNQIISANFSLYNNFNEHLECSAYVFEKSTSYNPPNFENKIRLFFEELGMPDDKISELFYIGKVLSYSQAGNLFQIFDLSYQDPFNKRAYEFVDTFNYPSGVKGVPLYYTTPILSELYQGTHASQFLKQFRIVVNHNSFLNPYSSISMTRYDLNDPETVKKYEAKLKEAIQSIPFNKDKVEEYKVKLKHYWNLDEL